MHRYLSTHSASQRNLRMLGISVAEAQLAYWKLLLGFWTQNRNPAGMVTFYCIILQSLRLWATAHSGRAETLAIMDDNCYNSSSTSSLKVWLTPLSSSSHLISVEALPCDLDFYPSTFQLTPISFHFARPIYSYLFCRRTLVKFLVLRNSHSLTLLFYLSCSMCKAPFSLLSRAS